MAALPRQHHLYAIVLPLGLKTICGGIKNLDLTITRLFLLLLYLLLLLLYLLFLRARVNITIPSMDCGHAKVDMVVQHCL